jgi:hypothetical protein
VQWCSPLPQRTLRLATSKLTEWAVLKYLLVPCKFVAGRLAGQQMADLCREFGISRKTGYKIFDRYQDCGVQGLTDRSRRPHHYAHKLPFQVPARPRRVEHEEKIAILIASRAVRRTEPSSAPGVLI